jgi:small-conductance mechanosensitive channel
MASSLSAHLTTLAASLVRWADQQILNALGMLQIGIVGITFLLTWLVSKKIGRYLEKSIKTQKFHIRIRLSPTHFSLVTRYVMWLLLMWFCQVLFSKTGKPVEAFHLAITFALAMLTLRFASFYIKSRILAGVFYSVSLFVIALRVFDLWQPAVHLLEGMTVDIGAIRFSMWGLIKAIAVFIVLWAAGSAARRFFAHWLSGSTHLTYSDRVLIQRAFNGTMATIVVLLSLHAAGIHMAAIAFTGGVIGIAIGMGLQKLGSNFVSGILLLLRKPIRRGDVIVLKDTFSGSRRGWVTRIGMMYVRVATRDGTEHLVPNETFVTRHIENLSYSDNRVRLRIPFGIAYKSGLKKAMALALEAARSTDRVLKAPDPSCVVTDFGDSNVGFEVRVWVEGPQQGLARVKSNLLLAIWDSFHNNGIEFAYPQRDLHIVDEGKIQGGIDILVGKALLKAAAAAEADMDVKR